MKQKPVHLRLGKGVCMEDRIKKLVSEMTLEEKAGLCSGEDFWHTKAVERLGIPSVMVSDGPHGLRKQEGQSDHLGLGQSVEAVCFPAACATACSFDTELIQSMGETLGEECQAEDISILLGPAVNIKRSPLCGRNFEYLSEDPYLAGSMAAAYISGVQKWDVGTSIKHFAVNNQEYRRMSCSSDLSERTLREIYLTAFEIAVKTAQPKTVMCSYNQINGVYASENKHLLTEILRDEWGFEGYVMTDWGAVADRVKGIQAGLELEMPGSGGFHDAKIVQAVRDGQLDEALLDRAIERILKVVFSYADHRHPEAVFDRQKDHRKAVEIETECAVLLENNGVLPLKADTKAVYIGAYAKTPRYQGGGSSHIHASEVSSALEAARKKGRDVTYSEGFPFDGDQEDEEKRNQAVAAARAADVAVIFAGLPDVVESEGYDRKDMKLPYGQVRLIEEVAAVQPNTIVVLHNGSPIEAPWADSVAAVLEMYLGGQGVGEACDRILYGEANPCGRLAETFPYRLEDNPSYLNFPGNGKNVNYAEGVFVGYRYYEAKKIPVRWAFGHGLSYTDYEYKSLTVSADVMDDTQTIEVCVELTNRGTMPGKEVVQLYIQDENGTPGRPVKELKAFQKIFLEPGETKSVTFHICARDLSYYEEALGDWYAASGSYGILVGHASDDIRLRKSIRFATKKRLPLQIDETVTLGELIADENTALLGKELLTLMQGDEKPDAEQSAMIEAMWNAMPLKSLCSFGGAKVGEQVERLIALMQSGAQ